MDRYVIEVAGRTRTVELQGDETRLTASVDGRRYELECLPVGRQGLSLRLGHRGWLARLALAQGHVRVALGRAQLDGQVRSELEWHLERQGGARGPGRSQAVLRAPMPGKLLKVNVSPGDVVEPGDPLVILEAMKMENELKATGRGKVVRVGVAPGTAVEGGTVLLEFGPAEEAGS